MRKLLLLAFVFFYSLSLYAQNSVQDCIGGIQVCAPIYTQVSSYSGYGPTNELGSPNSGCMYTPNEPGEDNSVWYIVTVTSPGIFAFNLTPNDLTTDYDWAMWDISSGGCYSIYNYSSNIPNQYPPVRCNISGNTGVTGMSTTACCPSEDAGNTPNFSSALTVTAGQTFAICINNWTGNTSGYTLDFTPSTASIYDTSHPRFDTIGTFCGATDSISFGMSEAIKCTSLAANGSDFYITPAVATPILAAGQDCAGFSTSTTFVGLKLSAPLPPGNYVLHSQVGTDTNTVLDYCGNAEAVGDSIAFSVVSIPTVSAPLTDSICLNDSAQLSCTVTNAPPGATYTYQWMPNVNLNNNTLANPKAAPQSTMRYTVNVIQSGPGACVVKDTTNVTVLPNDFTLHNPDTTVCLGAQVQVVANGNTAFSYSWTPAASVSNPSIINPLITPTSSGVYVVTANFPGCPPMSHSFKINVPPPQVLPTVSRATCIGTPIQFNVTVAGNTSYNYSWSPATYLSSASVPNPTDAPTAAGDITYVITMSPVTPGCIIFDSVKMHVLPGDFTLFNHDSTICIGATVQINASGDTEFTYTWTPVKGVSDPNIIDPSITPDASGTYTVTASYPGCPNMPHQLTYTVENAIADILTSDTAFCIQDPVQLYATAQPGDLAFTYTWAPGAGLSDPTIPDPVFFEDVAGTYTYYLTITTPYGCSNKDSITITAWQAVKLMIDPLDTIVNYGSSFQVNATNTYSEVLYYFWTPNDGTLDNPNIGNPVATPLTPTTYNLIAMNQYGCKDSGTVKVGINFAMDAALPNAFSPNGDGKNDVFRIVNLKYQKLVDFSVFNRWGNMVFHTTNPDKGWDGTFNSVPQDIGTYNYMIDLVLPDGTEKLYRGSVTLVR